MLTQEEYIKLTKDKLNELMLIEPLEIYHEFIQVGPKKQFDVVMIQFREIIYRYHLFLEDIAENYLEYHMSFSDMLDYDINCGVTGYSLITLAKGEKLFY